MNVNVLKAGFLSVALSAAFAPAAYAQMTWTDKAFVNVTFGGQAGSHTLDTSTTFDLYEEQGTVSSTQKAGGGGFFDVSGGYKFRRNLLGGVGYSWSGSKDDAAITALVPDPVVTDHPRTVNATASGMRHRENVIHLFAAYMIPYTEKIDFGISAGPAIYMVSQDLPTGVTVTEPGPTVNQVNTQNSDKTSVGFDLGVDVTYLMSKRWGIGGLMRYSWGSVKPTGATDSLTVGGFQIGAGVRFRFQ